VSLLAAGRSGAGTLAWTGTPVAGDDGLTGLTGLVADLIVALGEVGVLALVFLETVVPPIPSELVLSLAGWQAQMGRMSLPLTIAAATLGATFGSLVLYWLGARFGEARALSLMARLPLVEEEDLARAAVAFRRYGPAVVFFGRFLPIVRSLVSLPAGAQHMPLGRFVLLTAAGSAIWNTILVGGGYLLGTQYERLEGMLGWLDVLMIGAIAAGVGWLLIRHVRRRRAPAVPPARSTDASELEPGAD
jgi:membrane protein DedA with SNARE-associated domain